MAINLRITGGDRRGRKLFPPPKDSIRPASDMIRQAVFNMVAPQIEGCEFYDVFAGTAIVGIEALSRGARKAIFVENDRKRIALIERNINHVGYTRREAEVRMADAFLWARHFRPVNEPVIVFLGPPYELFAETELDRTMGLVARVQKSLREGDVLVLQFAREIHVEKLPEQKGWYRLRQYGKTQIGLWSISSESTEIETADEPASDD